MLNGSENREVKCFNICVGRGESETYMVKQSLYRQGKRNIGIEKVECRWGGDSRIMLLPLKGCSKKFQMSLCDVECCRCRD